MSQDWLQILDESVANLAGSTQATEHVEKKSWEVRDHIVEKNQDHDTTETTREEFFWIKDAYATSEIKGTEARNVQMPLEDGFSSSLALRKLRKDDEYEESCSYGSPGSVPFSWEAEPGKPKHPQKIEGLPPPLSPPPPLSLSSSFKSNNSNKSNSSLTDSHQRSLSGMVKGIFNVKGKESPSRKFQRSHSSLSKENFNSNGKESPLSRRSHKSNSFLVKEANSDSVLPSPHPLPLPPSPSPTTTLYGPGSSPKSSISVSPLHSHQSSGRSQHTDIIDHLPPLISQISFKSIHDFDIVDPLSASKDSSYASDPIDPHMESVEPPLLDPTNAFLESKDPFPMPQDSGQNEPCDPPFPASFTQSEHLVTQGMKPAAMSNAVPRSPISNSRLSFDLGGPWEHVLHTDGKSTYKLKAKSGPFPKPKRKVNNIESMVTTSTAAPARQASKLTGIGSLSFAEGLTRRDSDSKRIEDWIEEGAKGLIQGENDDVDDDDGNDEDEYLNYSFPRSRFTAMEMESEQGDENENGSEFSIEFSGQVGRWSSGRIRSINHAIESEAGFKAEEVVRSIEEVRFVISPVATAFVFANSGSDMYSENVGSLESLQIQSASDDYYADADPSKSAKLQQSHIKWGTYTNKRWFTWGWKVPKLKVPHCLRCHHGATNSFG